MFSPTINQETLIVWSEGDSCDLALSFQEKAGCDDIWEKICQVQGKDLSESIITSSLDGAVGGGEGGSSVESGGGGLGGAGGSDPEAGADGTGGLIGKGELDEEDEPYDSEVTPPRSSQPSSLLGSLVLPACELSKLEEISGLFNAYTQQPGRRDQLALLLESEGYIKKLLDLFKVCEDLENMESLHLIYQIFKVIFLLNKNALFEILFAEEQLKDVIGVLEYDPAVKVRRRHREYLWDKARFKDVMLSLSPELKAKIHQTYRVQYIQDVVFPAPTVFEENIMSIHTHSTPTFSWLLGPTPSSRVSMGQSPVQGRDVIAFA